MDERLEQARAAIRSRNYYSAFPESPSPRVYGAPAAAEGKAAFERHFGSTFGVSTPGASGEICSERSPYGLKPEISYPRLKAGGLDELVKAAAAGMPTWRDAGPKRRAEVCLAVLDALHARVFELAHAVQHTSGQAFVTAFQAGGTHALDRALEVIAYALEAMDFHADRARWVKPGRSGDLVVEKTFTVVPRGLGLVVGCNTFPTWNSYPGLFASLVTGNPVIVKPHPSAVLPLAITVQAAQAVLSAEGFDPHLVTLAAEGDGDRLAKDLATRPEVRVVDFTGSTAFGEWLEAHAPQARVYTEKAGVNPVVLDGTDDYTGMCDNLAFTLALYSGQMCTTSQNLFVPGDGVETNHGRKSSADVAASIGGAIERLLGEDSRAVEILGAIVSPAVLERLERADRLGEVLVASRPITHPDYPDAVIRTPTLIGVGAGSDAYRSESFGPVSFVVTTASTAQSLELLEHTVAEAGAITASVYSTSEHVLAVTRDLALRTGVALSENLTDGVYVNQSAAYSDFHGTGANPAANASYTDLDFVAGRFHVVQSRRHPSVQPMPG
jgi:phenylacetic acid degradation protein paaN